MDALEILVDAHKLIKNRSGWTRGVLARNKRGHSVPVRDSKAISFCATGALQRAALVETDEEKRTSERRKALIYLRMSLPKNTGGVRGSVQRYNDGIATHPQIVKLFSDAIKRARIEAASRAN